MGYKVKWVEDNLGITRKALRLFESAGLMPKNEDGKYRDYTEDDIERLWAIRVLQGMGYTLKEISQMAANKNFDFDNSIEEKVKELEEEKRKIELHLGYAKTIKLTGRFPARPSEMGSIKFEDFQRQAVEGWNVMDDPLTMQCQKVAETVLSKSPEEFEDSDLGQMFSLFENVSKIDPDVLLVEYVLPRAIAKRHALGTEHCDVQLMVKMIYENLCKLSGDCNLSKTDFSRFYSSSYLCGDMAKLKSGIFSEEERLFIANAVAVFGGYKDYDDLSEKEVAKC